MKIIFLGTSGSMPTRNRVAPAVAVRRKGEIFLFDCGEGTQQRMVAAGLGFGGRMRIFVSHLHGDHILGLPGLLQTMTLLRREHPLYMYGPRGLLEFVKAFSSILGGPDFPLEICEIVDGGEVFTGSEYKVEAVRADHEVEGWSYALVEQPRPGEFHPQKARAFGVPEGPLWRDLQYGKEVALSNGTIVRPEQVVDPPRRGRKLVYSGDTRPNGQLMELARGADVLIHEATFDDDLAERAKNDGHSTASQAAETAATANVGLLLLTHLSSRYPDTKILLEQARKVFPNTVIAEDLMEIEVPP